MNLNLVLVRTEHSANVGATMRAVANMGWHRLIMVNPRCKIDSQARQMAVGCAGRLSEIVHYPTWSEFYATEGEGLRIALTRRAGKKRRVTPLEHEIQGLAKSDVENLYLILGPESDGLDSEDMAFVNHACHLPVYGDFASLNLSQAALLAMYIVRREITSENRVQLTTGRPARPVRPFYFPDGTIRRWLEAMGFDISARRSSAYLTIRRLFLQNRPTRHEMQVLDAVLQQNIRKLSERSGNSVGFFAEELADHRGDVRS